MSATARMNRLFGEDGKCLDIALDLGIFNELSMMTGLEQVRDAVRRIAGANPDAIQLSPGQAPMLQAVPGRSKPSLVMRTDSTNVYGNTLPRYVFSHLIENAVEQAVRLDAACVVVNLLLLPNQPELHFQCVKNVGKLKPACEQFGMPLMVEPLVMQPNEVAGGYMVDGNIDKIVPLVRQAVELGADIIKADPCDHLEEYYKVIEAASGKPVLPRGGGRTSDERLLTRTRLLMRQGASGVVYGRNVVQHAHPDRMVAALMAIVHEEADEEAAMSILNGDRREGQPC